MPHLADELTKREQELVSMLAEEAAEVVQICMKIQRHGFNSYHPERPNGPKNRDELAREIEDFLAVSLALRTCSRITFSTNENVLQRIWNKKLRWTHHQR